MGNLKIDSDGGAVTQKWNLEGTIDEDSAFPVEPLAGVHRLVLNFEGIKTINSCGIREWIRWQQQIPPSMVMEFHNCPKPIVDQINLVKGFLPPQAEVKSFYVPYYCEETDFEQNVLFRYGVEFQDGQVMAPNDVVDPKTGDSMEMDVIEEKYFHFLKKPRAA